MAIDLVSLVTQFLTPDMVRKLAGGLGLDGAQAQTAVGGAVPGLLAGLSGTAAQSGGAQKLADAVNQNGGMLDNFAGMLGGSGQTDLVENGSKLVGSLLGSNGQTALSAAVSKFSGLGQGGATALLGGLAPAILGVIGKQAGPQGFDAASLGSLLASQKDNIANAMPPQLGGLLQGTGLLDSLGGAAAAATGTVKQAAASATQYAGSTAGAAAEAARDTARGGLSWLYWLLPLALIALGLWYFLGRPQQPVTPVSPAVSTNVVAPATPLMIGDLDVGTTLGNSLGTLRTSLEGVTDAATAQAALPQLQNVTADIDRVGSAVTSATAEQQAAVRTMASPIVATITPLFDRVLAIPGVGDILRPAVEGLQSKIAAIAG